MTLPIVVDRSGDAAIYRQIAEQIKERIGRGELPAGARLPTVRKLAAELGITRLTVQNAYADLQTDGWVEATVGRGTFVSHRVHPSLRLASPEALQSPAAVIGDILQMGQVQDVRSMASASPDPHLFPVDEFWRCLADQRADAETVVGYGPAQGDARLRLALSNELTERGIPASPEEILITAGVTQGLSLVARALAQPGDTVLVEQPTYIGFLHLLRAHGLKPVAIPMDEDGPLLDVLERIVVQTRPRFFYTVPTFQNPTGYSMSIERRERLIALAETHGFLLLEDDLYGLLAFDGPPPPPLRALDRGESTIYVNSFSKTLMPGLRLGYVLAPPPLHERLISLRLATDLGSPLLLQRTLASFLEQGLFRRHLRQVLPLYRERRDTALRTLRSAMPAAVRWTKPQGGLSCWVTLPRRLSVIELYRQALQQGWTFAPGDVFLPEPDVDAHLRLSFGVLPPEAIRRGIRALSTLIDAQLANTPDTFTETLELTSLV